MTEPTTTRYEGNDGLVVIVRQSVVNDSQYFIILYRDKRRVAWVHAEALEDATYVAKLLTGS